MNKLDTLKILLNITNDEQDNLLSILLDIAGKKIIEKAYPYENNIISVPTKYEYKQVEIAVCLYNKIGAEGETSHSENGISRLYENADVPESLLNGVVPFVGTIK